MTQDLKITANLSSQLATYRIREAIRRISTGKKTFYGGGASTSSAHSIAAEGAAKYGASLNLEDALAALSIAQTSLDEIANLNQRLAELGILQSNNSLLSTEDTASLNKETASITSAIDNIVSNTKYNNIALLGTSDISLSVGAGAYGGSNPLTITIGGISSIASVTAASNATSTSNTLTSTLGTNQGQVTGASTAAEARRNTTSTAAALLKSAAENIESADLAAETAKLTKNVLLNKVSLSLAAQVNNLDRSKLDLLG